MSSSSSTRKPVNMRNWAVKRIMQEAAELADPDTDDFVAAPLESDIFEWHCTVRGVQGTDYEGGLYHLRILLPSSYPMSAPDIILLTPNGRFELNKKICIDGLTSFHAGSWQPAWGVRTAITGLRSFWTQDGEALSAIGALDFPKEERRRLAKNSREWTCPTCQESNLTLLPDTVKEKDKSKEKAVANGKEGTNEETGENKANGVNVTPSEQPLTLPSLQVPGSIALPLSAESSAQASAQVSAQPSAQPTPLPSAPPSASPSAPTSALPSAQPTPAPTSTPAFPPPPAPGARPIPPTSAAVVAAAIVPGPTPAPVPAPAPPLPAVTGAARAAPGPTPAPAPVTAAAPTPAAAAAAVAVVTPARTPVPEPTRTIPPTPAPPALRRDNRGPGPTRHTPLWLDLLIGALFVLLIAILTRR